MFHRSYFSSGNYSSPVKFLLREHPARLVLALPGGALWQRFGMRHLR